MTFWHDITTLYANDACTLQETLIIEMYVLDFFDKTVREVAEY